MSQIAIIALLAFAWVGSAGKAQAEANEQTIVLAVTADARPLTRRLTQEFQALGLAVKLVAADAPHDAQLKREARAVRAVAGIHVASMPGGVVNLTIVDAATGKAKNWKLLAPESPGSAAAELIPTRVVELLRATLLELATPERTPERVSPAPPSQPSEEPPSSRLSLLTGVAALYTARFRPGAELQATLTWMPLPHFGLTGSALGPLSAARLTSPQGSVDLFASLFRVGAAFGVGQEAAPVSLRVSAGVGLDKLRFEGTPTAPYLGASEDRTTQSLFAGTAPRFRLARGLHIVSELTLGVAFPNTVVRLGGREATRWGRPFGTAFVGIEVTRASQASAGTR